MELKFLSWLQELHNPLLDQIMIFITKLGDKGAVWIILALLFVVTKKYRREGLAMGLGLLIMIIFGNVILKNLIQRPRPFYGKDIDLLIERPLDFSCPSGHTYSSFVSALVVFFYRKKEGTILLILASLIAFSRMYLYVHYPSDILLSIVLAFITALISRWIIEKKIYKNKKENKA